MNILITSASRKVSIVNAFKKALHKEGGGKVFTVDMSPFCAAFFKSDAPYLVRRDEDKSFLKDLLNFCRKSKIKLIVPTRDEELMMFAVNREKFHKLGAEIMVSGVKAIETCIDKVKFIAFCKDNFIPVPKTYSSYELKEGKVNYPLFVKNRFGKSAKMTFKVKNRDELNLALALPGDQIVQEYIVDKEYTVDLFADFKGRIISVVPRERIYCFGGESFIGRTCKNSNLIKAACDLAGKLRLIGHNTIQCFFGDNSVKFIEINPRYGGGANLGFAAGANTPLYLIQIIKGKKLKAHIGDFKDGLVMLRYTEDVFVDDSKLKKMPAIYEKN